MRKALLVSLVAHLAAVAGGALASWNQVREERPTRVYAVDIVGVGGGLPQGGKKAAPPPPAAKPSAKSGAKAERAPAVEKSAPQTSRKGAAHAAPDKKEERGKKAGAVDKEKGGGLRLDGEPFPFPEYLRDLVERIESHWQRPAAAGETQGLKATVFFHVLGDGALENCRVESGSGLMAFDRAALQAVLSAGPLPPLPQGFTGSRLGVHLDFE